MILNDLVIEYYHCSRSLAARCSELFENFLAAQHFMFADGSSILDSANTFATRMAADAWPQATKRKSSRFLFIWVLGDAR